MAKVIESVTMEQIVLVDGPMTVKIHYTCKSDVDADLAKYGALEIDIDDKMTLKAIRKAARDAVKGKEAIA